MYFLCVFLKLFICDYDFSLIAMYLYFCNVYDLHITYKDACLDL